MCICAYVQAKQSLQIRQSHSALWMRLKKRQSHSCMSASALKQSQSHSYCILKNDIPIHEWDCLAKWGVPISARVTESRSDCIAVKYTIWFFKRYNAPLKVEDFTLYIWRWVMVCERCILLFMHSKDVKLHIY